MTPDPTTSALERWTAERDQLRAEVARLTACLQRANANHEDFERRWYLAGDERDQLKEVLREVLDWATPFDGRHNRTNGGYSSELLPMFVRIGDHGRAERLEELRKLVGEA